MNQIEKLIEQAFENRSEISPGNAPSEVREAILEAIDLLDSGRARVAEKHDGHWQVNEWLKKAVLLYFRIEDNIRIDGGFTNYFDKVPLKFADYDQQRFAQEGFRVVPPATVRKGAHIAANVVLMPISFKLKRRSQEEAQVREMVLAGVLALSAGENPRVLEQKLGAYLTPAAREQMQQQEAA